LYPELFVEEKLHVTSGKAEGLFPESAVERVNVSDNPEKSVTVNFWLRAKKPKLVFGI
jgi:hypothetical protein